MDRIIKRILNWLIILITTSLVLLCERYENFYFTRVLIFKTILGIFRPKFSVIRIVLKRGTTSAIRIPFRIVSNTVPGLWEVNANKHAIVNSPPIAIIN
jgi:hypothetical protein